MREEGVLYARVGDLELRLEPRAPKLMPVAADTEMAPEDQERQDLEEMLHSTGLDAGALLASMRGQTMRSSP